MAGMDLSAFRDLFPALRRHVWLATPSQAPGATPVADALRDAIGEWADGDRDWPAYDESAQRTRQQIAALLGLGGPHDIALVQSVAEAAATVAGGLPAGSRVVVGADEYRSNLFPWLAARDRGVDVHEVPMPGGALPGDVLAAAVGERTTLVAVSAVQSATGYRTDLRPVAARCARTGTRLFVDATQSAGVLPLGVEPDFVAVHGYKWLVGPRGAAWLYVRPDRLGDVRPIAPNHKSTTRPWSDYYGGPLDLAPDARRLDMSLGWPAWAAAGTALDLVAALDPAAVEAHCLGLAASFRARCPLPALPSGLPSHIVSVAAPPGAAQALAAAGVKATVRAGHLRLGFHAFNTEADVETALRALPR